MREFIARFGAVAAIAAMLGGCAQTRPPMVAECVLPAYEMIASADLLPRKSDAKLGVADVGEEPFRKLLTDTIGPGAADAAIVGGSGEPVATPAPRTTKHIAVLSGGSQNGSFGAGLFKGLDEHGDVPDYRIVTAISTGALQSTFVFLANRPVPTDRVYPDYMKAAQGVGAVGKSNLGDLRLAYALSSEADVMDVAGWRNVSIVRKGSVARFDPLRSTLRGLISPQTLAAIAAEGQAERTDGKPTRKLLVGVANLDDGKAYAIDMTRLAGDPRLSPEAKRDCYVETLLASSTVPPGVPPVTLKLEVIDKLGEGRNLVREPEMFIDGGARYGVFIDNVIDVAKLDEELQVDVVVNSAIFEKPWTNGKGEPIDKWSIYNVGLRSVDILQNQVYQLSVERVLRWARDNGNLRMAFISKNRLHTFQDDPLTGFVYDGGTTCAAALEADKRDFPLTNSIPATCAAWPNMAAHEQRATRGISRRENNAIAPFWTGAPLC